MGGRPPLGYDVKDRKLVVNEAEAKTVRQIFQRYLDLGCVRTLRDELRENGVTSKRWTTCDGIDCGGTSFDRGALYNLLKNRLYTGHVPFKGALYEGEHEAIVPNDLFETVRAKMETLRRCPLGKLRAQRPAILTGILFDETDRPMTPSYSVNPTGRRYRYYLSRTDGAYSDTEPPSRVPALLVERIVQDAAQRFGLQGGDGSATIPAALKHITLKETTLELRFDSELVLQAAAKNRALTCPRLVLARCQAALRDGEELTDEGGKICVRTPLCRTRRGRYAAHFPEGSEQTQPDAALIAALARAHRWKQLLVTGEVGSIGVIAARTGSERTHVGRTLKLAFLSPDLTRDILEGRQPSGLSLAQLLDADLPLAWRDQPAFLQALAQAV